MGPGLVTDIFKRAQFKPDEIIKVEDEDAFEWTRLIAQREGLLVGLTSGALAWAAHQVAGRKEFEDKIIVTIFYDTGERYLSVPDLFPDADITTVSIRSWTGNRASVRTVDATRHRRIDGQAFGGNLLVTFRTVTVVAILQAPKRRLDSLQPSLAADFQGLRHGLDLKRVHP